MRSGGEGFEGFLHPVIVTGNPDGDRDVDTTGTRYRDLDGNGDAIALADADNDPVRHPDGLIDVDIGTRDRK